jgi:hypothetical protein
MKKGEEELGCRETTKCGVRLYITPPVAIHHTPIANHRTPIANHHIHSSHASENGPGSGVRLYITPSITNRRTPPFASHRTSIIAILLFITHPQLTHL